MKYAIIFLAALYTNISFADTSAWKFVKVTDGDTVEFRVTSLPGKLSKVKIRIYGIDTPESTSAAKCEKEKALGKKAKKFVMDLITPTSSVKVVDIQGWDKYGGRVLADVEIDGKSLRNTLLEAGLARAYQGEAKGNYWCL